MAAAAGFDIGGSSRVGQRLRQHHGGGSRSKLAAQLEQVHRRRRPQPAEANSRSQLAPARTWRRARPRSASSPGPRPQTCARHSHHPTVTRFPIRYSQVRQFQPKMVAIKDAAKVKELKELIKDVPLQPEILVGDEGAVEVRGQPLGAWASLLVADTRAVGAGAAGGPRLPSKECRARGRAAAVLGLARLAAVFSVARGMKSYARAPRPQVARHPECEAVVTGIVGCAGLLPTVAAIKVRGPS